MNDRIDIRMLLGYCKLEQRYVQTGPGKYTCEGRRLDFDEHGALRSEGPWEAISSVSDVPDELAYMLR